ncbi:glycogen synthase GlgA, partial [uncultured Amaricoccus sp.]|uniref:glycogen synthase GlgA n=1 Tax=uncultured Amaricoccus sp. TaxID=339341 RepID=UPI002622C0BA
MRVLSVASEAYPLVKTGGLADVAGALPPALARRGIEVRTLLPGYPAVMARLGETRLLHEYQALLGVPARLLAATVAGLELVVIDSPPLYDRPGGPYGDPSGRDHPDNWRRFGALGRAAVDIAMGLVPEFLPDLVHAHDWQAGLAPAYLRFYGVPRPSVMTIHNIAFQGGFPPSVFGALELPPQAAGLDGVEFYGGVGYLKAGIANASAITTVSPTYAEEIKTPAYGMGLDGLIAARADVLHGIVNGIDTEVWNPETDRFIPAAYTARRLQARAANRTALAGRFGLHNDDSPLFVLVSRLTWQKGIDLLAWITAEDIVRAGHRLAVLGTGEPGLEHTFRSLAAEFPGRVGAVLGYDEPLAHLMQAGGDAILIPSRFEPCGLTQLYGLRYGCVPIVARTGGLADTVIDANVAALNAGAATGFQFTPVDAAPLAGAIRRAAALMRDKAAWSAIQRQGMKADVSWDRSAAAYADLYASLLPAGQ